MTRLHPEASRVEVEWVDSVLYDGWRERKDVVQSRRKDVRCVSVGLLLADDKHGITLASSAHGTEVAGAVHIPRAVITRVRRIWRAQP